MTKASARAFKHPSRALPCSEKADCEGEGRAKGGSCILSTTDHKARRAIAAVSEDAALLAEGDVLRDTVVPALPARDVEVV